MKGAIKTLAAYFRQHPPNLGDEESILDALFWMYTENNNLESKEVKTQFAKLRENLSLPPEEYDEVFYIVSSLCLEHGKLAFQGGFALAMALMQEVENI